jgi:hypothetical protein
MGDADGRHATARGIELAQRSATRAGIVAASARPPGSTRRRRSRDGEQGRDQGVHPGAEGGSGGPRSAPAGRLDTAAQDTRQGWRAPPVGRDPAITIDDRGQEDRKAPG